MHSHIRPEPETGTSEHVLDNDHDDDDDDDDDADNNSNNNKQKINSTITRKRTVTKACAVTSYCNSLKNNMSKQYYSTYRFSYFSLKT